MISPNEPQGCLPGIAAWLFGSQAKRLREQASRAHLLSYLLIISQSIAVVLVFGHAEVGLLLSRSVAVRIMALLALFVLVITVIAADLALVETMKRIPVLKRNRQGGALFEHRAYQWFVLIVEGATYGVVLYTLDSDPQALVQGRSLIPTTGLIFLALVVMRVTLISWSAVQLIIVRGKLPVLLSTLMNTGKEIVGAHLEHQLETMNIADMAMHDLFGVYARMVQPPRPIAGILNFLTAGWLVRRALLAEAEEERQANNVKAALAELRGTEQPVTLPAPQMYLPRFEATAGLPAATPEGAQTASSAESDHLDLSAEAIMERVRRELHLPADAPLDEPPPDDGGAPTFASKRIAQESDNVTPLRRGMGRASAAPRRDRRVVNRANARAGKRGSAEYRVRHVAASKPEADLDEVARQAKVSPSTASKWLEVIAAENRVRTHREAQ